MQLKKILEEMEQYRRRAVENGDFNVAAAHEKDMNIIRKHMNDGWIPVERGLPPNAKHEGEFCPKYQVMTKYGVTEGWYNPDEEGWYVLIWFMTERYKDSEVDLDMGDVPKVVFLPDEVNNARHILTAWHPPSGAVPDGKEHRMNQGIRYILRTCLHCKKKKIRVKQVYNTHISDWEDVEPWICEDCWKGARENE